MTNYLVRLQNNHKVNEACNGRLISRGVQEHGTKIIYPLYVTSFGALSYDYNNEEETAGEEILCSILYLEYSYNASFSYLKKRVNNYYVLNKA